MRITRRVAITVLYLCFILVWVPPFTEGFPLIDMVAWGTAVLTIVALECYGRYGPGFALSK